MPDEEWEDVKVERPEGRNIVNVTESHIRRGTRDMFGDPVSLAVKEVTGADWAMSGWGYAKTGHPNNIRRSWTLYPPKILSEFLRRWDKGLSVSPIEFHILLDTERDMTPKESKRKPRQHRTFADEQIRLGLR
jgi:hypothetical protein